MVFLECKCSHWEPDEVFRKCREDANRHWKSDHKCQVRAYDDIYIIAKLVLSLWKSFKQKTSLTIHIACNNSFSTNLVIVNQL